MRYNLRAIVLWLSIIILFGLVLLVPRGCVTTYEKVGISETGTPTVKFSPSKPLLSGIREKEEEQILPQIYKGDYGRQDYFFLALYSYDLKIDLSGAPQAQPFSLSITMPGSIASHNADNVSGNTATWALGLGRSYEIKVASRAIRWWAIVLALLSLVGLGYAYFTRRRI